MGRIILTSSPVCIFTALKICYSWSRVGLVGSICYSILSLTWPDKIREVFLFVWCKIWCYIKLSCSVSDTELLKYRTKAVKLDEWMLFTTESRQQKCITTNTPFLCYQEICFLVRFWQIDCIISKADGVTSAICVCFQHFVLHFFYFIEFF